MNSYYLFIYLFFCSYSFVPYMPSSSSSVINTNAPVSNQNTYTIITVLESENHKYEFDECYETTATNKRELINILFNDSDYTSHIIDQIDNYVDQYSEDDIFDILQLTKPLTSHVYRQYYNRLINANKNELDTFINRLQTEYVNTPLFFIKKTKSNPEFIEFCNNYITI